MLMNPAHCEHRLAQQDSGRRPRSGVVFKNSLERIWELHNLVNLLKTNNILLFLFGVIYCSFKGTLSVLSLCYAGQYGTSLGSILTTSDMDSASRKSRKTVFRY